MVETRAGTGWAARRARASVGGSVKSISSVSPSVDGESFRADGENQTEAGADPRGASAQAVPSAPGWVEIGRRVSSSIFEHRLLATSGGVAFFALMAIFPALATIVSLYGLFADPHAIPQRLATLAGVVPTSVIDLLKQEIQHLVETGVRTLSTAFVIGLLVSIWSANAGVSALFDALNVVHGATEERSLIRFYATTFAVTLGSVVYGLAIVIGAPADRVPLARLERKRRNSGGHSSLAGGLADRHGRAQHRLSRRPEPHRGEVALGDLGQRAGRHRPRRRLNDLRLVC